MSDTPGFDPFEILGVGEDADAVLIQLAYRARIRQVHPDIAGAAGLEHTKRLNAARDWLLNPRLRAQLVRPPAPRRPGAAAARGSPPPSRGSPPPYESAQTGQRASDDMAYDRWGLDPDTFDFGSHTAELRAFFGAIRALTRDERARVNYSLGDQRPVFFEAYRDYLGPQLWSRSRVLRDAVSLIWLSGVDEEAPYVFPLGHVLPSGFLVANASAQWVLLGDFLKQELEGGAARSEHLVESFAARCAGPWEASVQQARYGPHQGRVAAFLESANALTVDAAARLARSWRRHMGEDALGESSDHIGPGVWLPAPPNYPDVLKVSGYLAAVDASRIEPPAGLAPADHHAYRYGLRLTAHVLALGLVSGSGRDYLQPWRDATEPDRSLWRRLRARPTS